MGKEAVCHERRAHCVQCSAVLCCELIVGLILGNVQAVSVIIDWTPLTGMHAYVYTREQCMHCR